MIFFFQDLLNYLTLFAVILAGFLVVLFCYTGTNKLTLLVKQWSFLFATVIAWAGTLGSLFFSEIVRLAPCSLCWYQRVFMYSLAVILLVAIIRKEKLFIIPYAIILSVMGGIFAAYQYFLQMAVLSNIQVNSFIPCTAGTYEVSCTSVNFISFGFITIPFMSLIAFIMISLLLAIQVRKV